MAEQQQTQTEYVFNIPLREMKCVPYTIRANKAVIVVREYVMRHTKSEEKDVWIDGKVNEALWFRGIQKPPSKIKVKAVKFEDGLVEVSLPEEQ
jgi:large subunit ribosomal protein L31e